MVRSLSFGSIIYDLYRPVQTRFPFGSMSSLTLNLAIYNNSPDRSTKSTTSHIYSALSACKHRVSGSFHSPPGVLFNFPSRYFSTIGHQVVFSLMGWSPHIHTRFHVSCTTLHTAMLDCFSLTRLSLSMVYLSK